MTGTNSTPAQKEQQRENAKRQAKDPVSAAFDKKLDGENRPAE